MWCVQVILYIKHVILLFVQVQINNNIKHDTFTELPVSLVFFSLICIDVVERIRHCRLTGQGELNYMMFHKLITVSYTSWTFLFYSTVTRTAKVWREQWIKFIRNIVEHPLFWLWFCSSKIIFQENSAGWKVFKLYSVPRNQDLHFFKSRHSVP